MRSGQLITGIALILFGIGAGIFPFFLNEKVVFAISWIYGGIAIIIGIVILLNKEDEIERIKTSGKVRK